MYDRLKKSLNQDLGLWLTVAVIILVGIGTANVGSATFYMNLHAGDWVGSHLVRHIVFVFVGVVTAAAAYGVVKSRWLHQDGVLHILGLVTLLLLLAVYLVGVEVNGARRWIPIGPLTFQPSEVAKFIAIMWSAKYLAVLRKQKRPIRLLGSLADGIRRLKGPFATFWRRLADAMWAEWKPISLPLAFALAVIFQPDMGTTVLIVGFPIMLYILAGLPGKEIIGTLAVAILLGAGLVFVAPYRLERLIAYYDPFRYAQDIGYQSVQSIIAVGSGGLLGQGFGRGHSKYAYLPEQYTDFAYSVWAQEAGFFLSLLVVLLFVAILLLGWRMAMRTQDRYGRYCIYGLTAMLAGQGLYNIGMTIGIMPVTGVPLPFISFGGTSMVVCLTAVGTILGIWQLTREKEERRERERRREALTAGRPTGPSKSRP